MKPRKNRGQIKIAPKVKKQLYSAKVSERVTFASIVEYPKAKSPIKAIRNKCLWCCGDSSHEVSLCPIESCVLWEFRKGKNPYHTKDLSEEQIAAMTERLQKARAVRLNNIAEEKKTSVIRRRKTI